VAVPSGPRIAEYLKLARSFNLALTAVGPVFGALAMGEGSILRLFILFFVGAGAHIYGFVLNDYIDMRIDGLSGELRQRPLVSGTISPRAALSFALFGLAMMLALGYLSMSVSGSLNPSAETVVFGRPRVMSILVTAAVLATIYNLISKHLPGMDVFVAAAVFFLCVFGAASTAGDIMDISRLGWIVCTLGGLQVLFMNIVAGGLKDIDHDSRGGGRTLAVALGCRVGEEDDSLTISGPFQALAYLLQALFLLVLFSPFVLGLIAPGLLWSAILVAVLVAISAAMLWTSRRLLDQNRFQRDRMRKYIGTHYILNYVLVPVMLAPVNPYILLLTVVPPMGFVLSNMLLSGAAMKPKTM
jgi:4-hydroxybenzoate polyprenyltransferase